MIPSFLLLSAGVSSFVPPVAPGRQPLPRRREGVFDDPSNPSPPSDKSEQGLARARCSRRGGDGRGRPGVRRFAALLAARLAPVGLSGLAVVRRSGAVHAGRAEPDRPARAHQSADSCAGAEPRHRSSTTAPAPTATTSAPSGARTASTPRATSQARRSRPRRLVGATNIKVTSVTPFSVGQTIWIDATSDAEQVTIAAVGTAGSAGTGLDLTAPLAKAHANGRPAYVIAHDAEHLVHLLDGRPGRAQHVGPERARLDRADDADGPRGVVRPLARQRLGPDRGRREPRLHGHRHVRPADRPRPAAQLGPEPDDDRRGSRSSATSSSPPRSRGCRASARCRR